MPGFKYLASTIFILTVSLLIPATALAKQQGGSPFQYSRKDFTALQLSEAS